MVTLFFFLLCLLNLKSNSQILCSSHCSPNFCSGPDEDQCTGCLSPFVLVSNRCQLPTGTIYTYFGGQSLFTTNTWSIGSCGIYSFNGPLSATSQLRVTTRVPITTSHFRLNLKAWVLLIDGWTAGADNIYANLIGIGNLTVPVQLATISNQINICGGTGLQYYKLFHGIYPHYDVVNPVQFVFDVYSSGGKTWGIKDFWIYVEHCHYSCYSCTSALNTTCTGCKTNYKLSGTTCHSICLTGYGQTSNPLLCVLCDTKCLVCYGASYNCSSCVTSGVNESFLYLNTCILACPIYYIAYTATHKCEKCSNNNCLVCTVSDLSICNQCDSYSYWLTSTCYKDCPTHYFEDVRNCTACALPCSECTGTSSTCTSCYAPDYLLNSLCGVCPDTHFGYDPTRVCLDCSIHCVKANLEFSIKDNALEAIVCFTHEMDFNTFPYQTAQEIKMNDTTIPEQRFITTYEIISDRCYMIKKESNRYIDLDNVHFTFEMKTAPSTDQYINFYKLSPQIYTLNGSLIWDLLLLPGPSDQDWQFIEPFRQLNDNMNTALALPGVQQIKKAGLFAMICPGIQLSSTAILHNGTPPENMYEAMRFWGTMVFFEVPRWEKDGNNTKYVVSNPVTNILSTSRLLQTTILSQPSVPSWRFERTGHTTYYVLDVYVPLILLASCWIGLFLSYKCGHKVRLRYRSIMYSIIHKIHEIMIFYLFLSTLLQWVMFSAQQNSIKGISLALSILMIVYILLYEAFIFYKLIPYGAIDIGSEQFANFVEKYSYFLKDIRHEHYLNKVGQWSIKHFLRPYNYQVLSFYRLVLFISALPLFQDFNHGTLICLIVIQVIEIFRYFLTWPYFSLWRNIYKISLETLLLISFSLFLGETVARESILENINTTLIQDVDEYYRVGWAGFVFFFMYNSLYVVYALLDIIIGCEYTNWERMQFGRRAYYQEVFKNYRDQGIIITKDKQQDRLINFLESVHGVPVEQSLQTNPKKLLSTYALKGNLLKLNYNQLSTATIKIEQYEIVQLEPTKYEIKYDKVKDIYMKSEISEKKNNLLVHHKENKIILTPELNDKFYLMMKSIYDNNAKPGTQCVTLSTFAIIDQGMYSPGDKIILKAKDMFQEVTITGTNQDSMKNKLARLLPGFPLRFGQIDQI